MVTTRSRSTKSHHKNGATNGSNGSSKQQPHILIVGGSFAGLTAARILISHKYHKGTPAPHVTVIEPREYFEYVPSVLRSIVKPEHLDQIVKPLSELHSIPHDNPNFTLLQDTVTSIDSHTQTVHTQSDDELLYDFLILATGSHYDDPIRPTKHCVTIEERREELYALHKRLQQCNKVTLIGGGLVGVEFAAELAVYMPHLQVTLRELGNYLLPGLPHSAQVYSKQWLEQHHVEVINKSEVKPADYKTSNGELMFNCTGNLPQHTPPTVDDNDKLQDKKKQYTVDPKKKRDQHFQLQNCNNVFAIGDGNDFQNKYAYFAEQNAILVSENIIELMKHADSPSSAKLLQWPDGLTGKTYPAPQLVAVSLGNFGGIVIFNGICMTGVIGGFTKWFIENTKMQQYHGDWFGSAVWAAAEPCVFLANRLWHKAARTFGKEQVQTD